MHIKKIRFNTKGPLEFIILIILISFCFNLLLTKNLKAQYSNYNYTGNSYYPSYYGLNRINPNANYPGTTYGTAYNPYSNQNPASYTQSSYNAYYPYAEQYNSPYNSYTPGINYQDPYYPPYNSQNQVSYGYNQSVGENNYYPYEQTQPYYGYPSGNYQNPYYPSYSQNQGSYNYNQVYNQNPYLPVNNNPYINASNYNSYANNNQNLYYNQIQPNNSYPPNNAYNNQNLNYFPNPPNTNPQTMPTNSSTDIFIDTTFSGQEIKLAVGRRLTITLPSNASSGYKWNLNVNYLDTDILEKEKDLYYQITDGYVGTGGYEEWIFKAVERGVTNIKLDYSPIFDSSSIGQTFRLEVTVY